MQVEHKVSAKTKISNKYNDLKSDKLVKLLSEASFAEIDKWVDGNIKDVGDVRAALKTILPLMAHVINNARR